MTDPTGPCEHREYLAFAVVIYYPKRVDNFAGQIQVRSLAGYFISPEAVRQFAPTQVQVGKRGWNKELQKGEVPGSSTTIPLTEERVPVSDSSKIVNGYLILEKSIYSKDGGRSGRLLGPHVRLCDHTGRAPSPSL